MTNSQNKTTRYQDHSGKIFNSIDELAAYRLTYPGPLLGGASCSAAQNTFAVSTNNGASWHNPTGEQAQALIRAIVRNGQCCQGYEADCWARRQT